MRRERWISSLAIDDEDTTGEMFAQAFYTLAMGMRGGTPGNYIGLGRFA